MSAAEERNRTILERAARRLEQLNRSTADADSAARPEPAPRIARALPARAEIGTELPLLVQPRDSVQIDLDRLARMGYVPLDGARTPLAEQLRVIKLPLLANVRGDGPVPVARANLVMVTSGLPGEGKTYTAINLAMSIASEHDVSVVLVDCDLAQPSVMQRLGLRDARGLTELLVEPDLSLDEVVLGTNVPRLSLLPVGAHRKGTSEMLTSDAMAARLRELERGQARQVVVFDSPPLLRASEASRLASQVGQVVVVVEAEKTRESDLREALAMIDGCPVVSLVLNKARASRFGSAYQGYGY
jgi:receptor protein-tyrosine kinase